MSGVQPSVVHNCRQRVIDALQHREPDRIPVDFGSTAVTGVHVSIVARLRDYFGLEKRPVKVHEPFQMLGMLDEDLKQVLGVDVEGVWRRKNMFGFENTDWKPWGFNGLEVLVPGQFNTTLDDSGDVLLYPEGDLKAQPSGRMPKAFHFFDVVVRQNHFDEDHLNVENNTEEFEHISDQELQEIAEDVAAARISGRALVASFSGMALGDIALVPTPWKKDPRGIRDVTEWYVSTRARPDYIHAIFDRQTSLAVDNLRKIHSAIGEQIDAVFLCGTDFGTQTSSFCSIATFRELWLPYYKRMCNWIHQHTSWKTFKHCCGAVEPFMSSFIDAGFDIINPVQCSASGMDPGLLKARYGEQLVFWGGGVDTQHVLPFGTPTEVRDQVLRRCEIFGKKGGFVFNSIHNIQACTPVENVVAMIEAIREFNGRR
jgi:uroporphyrinogen-III decarboxylase